MVVSSFPVDLAALHEEDLRAERNFREGQYELLVPTYREAVRLMTDQSGRECLFADPFWITDYRGRRPKPGKDGPEEAFDFAIRRVFGGRTRYRGQRASMIVRASRRLLSRGIEPEDVVAELKRRPDGRKGSGFKAIAAKNGKAEAHSPSQALVPKIVNREDVGSHTPPDGVPAPPSERRIEGASGGPGKPTSSRGDEPRAIIDAEFTVFGYEASPCPERRTIVVICPPGSPADRLHEELYLVPSEDGEAFVLSVHPTEPVELRIPAGRRRLPRRVSPDCGARSVPAGEERL